MTAIPGRPRSAVKKYGAVALLVLILAAVLLFPRFYEPVEPAGETLRSGEIISAPACDLPKGPCVASRAGLSVELAVDADVFRSYEPLEFRLTIDGMQPDTARIEFEGVDMFMGVNSLQLVPAGKGRYSGTIALPGHAHAMTWRARVQLHRAGTPMEAVFLFDLK